MFLKGILVSFVFLISGYAYSDLTSAGHVPNQLIVKFKNSKRITSFAALRSAKLLTKLRASNTSLIELQNGEDLEQVLSELINNPDIDYVGYNKIYKLQAQPNDSDFSKLYGMDLINAPLAWEITTGSKDVLVGVIDSGIDYNHPDLVDNIWTNPGESGLDENGNDKSTNNIDDDNNGYIDDLRGWDFMDQDNTPLDGLGHGTHVAGTIGATGNNQKGVVGVNWNVSLAAIRIFDNRGLTNEAAIAEAIEYSTKIGVDLTNNSWGGNEDSVPIKAAIKEASEKEILFVAAAGNSRTDNDKLAQYPASYEFDNILAVASITSAKNLSSFSCFGKESVDVGAPGSAIYSTMPNGRYKSLDGTSMASPHVAGLAALIKSAYPDVTLRSLKSRLMYTGNSIDALKNKIKTGKIVDALSALQIDEVNPEAPNMIEVSSLDWRSVKVKWSLTGDDGADGNASAYEIRTYQNEINLNNWEDAKLVTASQSLDENEGFVVIENLPLNDEGFIAIRALDDVGNLSEIVESKYQTQEVAIIYNDATENIDNYTATGKWGLEDLKDGKITFSDSPYDNYDNRDESSLTINKDFEIGDSEVYLSYYSKHVLSDGDIGYLDLSFDGGKTWVTAKEHSGVQDWEWTSINISDYAPEGATNFKYRFRISTSWFWSNDGWKIDKIQVLR